MRGGMRREACVKRPGGALRIQITPPRLTVENLYKLTLWKCFPALLLENVQLRPVRFIAPAEITRPRTARRSSILKGLGNTATKSGFSRYSLAKPEIKMTGVQGVRCLKRDAKFAPSISPKWPSVITASQEWESDIRSASFPLFALFTS